MNHGKYVFAQFIEFISHNDFNKYVKIYNSNYRLKLFSTWNHFLCLCYGQITQSESLRSIVLCLNAQRKKLYHLGINSDVKRSTLSDANNIRDWRVFEGFAQELIKEARKYYIDNNDFNIDLDNTAYALDASTIDLCLSIFPWAQFKKNKGAVRLHTLMDMRGSIPVFIHITDGKVHDVNVLDIIEFEFGAFYVMDRGYVDFGRLYKIHRANAFFTTRLKTNIKYVRMYSNPVDRSTGLICDQVIRLTNSYEKYPEKLRRIKYVDRENNITYEFLTNNFIVSALTIAILYKYRWKIETFFKWIKQHLKIKKFWSRSENAVKIQIWVAVIVYLTLAIIKKKLKTEHSIYELSQIIGSSVFDKSPLNELLNITDNSNAKTENSKQFTLWQCK